MGIASLMDAALDYAERGWYVLPLHTVENGVCSCGRACKQPGKHPRTRNGLHDASIDPDVIATWWGDHPQSNIGIRTGRISNLWVLDIDAKRSIDVGRGVLIPEGENTLRTMEDRFGERIPDTLTSRTGGGGTHYLFTFPEDGDDYRNRVRIAPSIDVRGDNGYIVAPPSVHATGKRYEWDDEAIDPAVPPAWLLSVQDRPEGGESEFREGEVVQEGGRNDALFRYASKLRGEDRDPDELANLVVGYNQRWMNPPLEADEVGRIIRNALKLPVNPPEAVFEWDEPAEDADIDDGEDIFLSFRDLMLNPPKPKEPLIHEGILDKGDGFILGGVSGAGKSWLAFDLGLSVATGSRWLDRFETEQCTVLYVDEEAGISSSWERIEMLAKGRGIENQDIPFRIASMKGIKLDSPKGMAAIARALHRYRPGLVIFDALVRFHNGDENSTKDMAEFFDRAKGLKEAYNTAFMFLHHVRKPGKDDAWDNADMLRGSSDVRGWPDSAIVVSPNEGRDGVYVAHVKSRNHRQLPNFEVGRVIDETDGTARHAYRGDQQKAPTGTQEIREAIYKVVSTVINSPVTSPLIAGMVGLTEDTVNKHLAVMVEDGRVVRANMGRGQAPTYLVNHNINQGSFHEVGGLGEDRPVP